MGVRRSAVLLAIVVLLAVVAGCGGDSSGDGSDGSSADEVTITKAVLIKKGDAICRKTDQAQKAALSKYSKEHPDALVGPENQEKALAIVALPPIASEIDEITSLGVPAGDEISVEAFLTEMRKSLKKAEGDPGLLLALGNPFERAGKMAGKYGFKDCAKAQ